MTTRCKPGDVAIIIYDEPECASNIGRFVRVRGPVATNREGQLTWLIQPVSGEPYLIRQFADGQLRAMLPTDNNIEHPDAWMIPVRPEADDEEVVEHADLVEEVS